LRSRIHKLTTSTAGFPTCLTPNEKTLIVDTRASITITTHLADFIKPPLKVGKVTVKGIAAGLTVAGREWLNTRSSQVTTPSSRCFSQTSYTFLTAKCNSCDPDILLQQQDTRETDLSLQPILITYGVMVNKLPFPTMAQPAYQYSHTRRVFPPTLPFWLRVFPSKKPHPK
jgi:hypothetical protein